MAQNKCPHIVEKMSSADKYTVTTVTFNFTLEALAGCFIAVCLLLNNSNYKWSFQTVKAKKY